MTMPSRLAYLNEMGVEVYTRRGVASSGEDIAADATALQPPPSGSPDPDSEGADHSGDPADRKAWRLLEQEVAACTICALHASRTRTVFGVGDRCAEWLFIGEGPGFEEDRQGEPFVGRAGKLLDKMLVAIGLDRSRVYIANTVKCRPPENRNPRPEELAACNGYLQRQISLIRPRIIVALGGVAANTLLRTENPVGKLRGKVYRFDETDIPIVVTYHPAYLLRSPLQKKASWEDLQLAQRVVAGEETFGGML